AKYQTATLRMNIVENDKASNDIDTYLKIFDLKDNREDRWKSDYINAIETQEKLYGVKGMFDEAQANLDRTRKMIRKSNVPVGNELSTAEELSSLFIQLRSEEHTS